MKRLILFLTRKRSHADWEQRDRLFLINKKNLTTTIHFSLAPANFNRETICQRLGDRPRNWKGSLQTRDWEEVEDQASAPGSQTQPVQATLRTRSQSRSGITGRSLKMTGICASDLVLFLSLYISFLTHSVKVLQSSSHQCNGLGSIELLLDGDYELWTRSRRTP